ncbi:MAG: ABC transporter substrate-binding protein [Deltaproteobacteria bacterium]|nr:ABC transporter substrate-binding protein [Deltaproteobacteria bacterium]
MKRFVLASLVVASVVAAESRPHYGGALEGSLLGAPVTLDPPLAQSHAELTAVELVFDTLYRTGPAGLPQPHLAAGPPILAGGKLQIELKTGVKFHDGSELGGADVAASLERIRTTPSRWALAGITAISYSGTALELTTSATPADAAKLLALPATAITKGGKPQADRPVGSGPFVVDAWDKKGRLVLKAFDNHFAGRPYLDQLTLRWYDTPDGEARQFEKGDAQLSSRGVAVFTGVQPKFKSLDVEGPAALLVFVGFGRVHADVMADRSFRRALDLALARGAMTSVTSGERLALSRVPLPVEAGGPMLDAAGRLDNLVGAKAALADAAKRVKSLAPDRLAQLKLEILIDDTRPDDRELAERTAHALTKLSIASVITAVPAATLRERVKRGDCDLWIGQLAAPVTSAPAWWGVAFAAGGDTWAEQRLAAGPIDNAIAQKAFADRLPIVPLLFRAVRIWHRSDVRGLGFDATGRPSYADMFLYGEPTRAQKVGKP